MPNATPEQVLELVRGLGILRRLVEDSHLSVESRAAIALRVASLRRAQRLPILAASEPVALSEERRQQAGQGWSSDPREQLMLAIATKVALELGDNCRFVVEQARRAGLAEDEIVETIARAALTVFPVGGGDETSP